MFLRFHVGVVWGGAPKNIKNDMLARSFTPPNDIDSTGKQITKNIRANSNPRHSSWPKKNTTSLFFVLITPRPQKQLLSIDALTCLSMLCKV